MSTVDSALVDLRDGKTPKERLRAARFLATEGTPRIIGQLQNIRRLETDSWVKSAIDSAIQRLLQGHGTLETGQAWISIPDDPELEDVKAEAIQSVSQTLIHEIRPLLERIQESSEDEIQDFPQSSTAKAIERLQDFLRTLQALEQAASPPQMIEFDLRDLLISIIDILGFTDTEVVVSRAEPVITRGAPDLLAIALSNVIKNAVEASTDPPKRVVVNCGATDHEAWVVVLDEGEGLPLNYEKAWEPGRTTKSKESHFGWGLSIAQRAVHSFQGTINLKPREPTGAACEIRWPIPETSRG